jgi:retron-type reverse transcriptase
MAINKASGLDRFSAKLVKTAAGSLAKHLTFIINQSFNACSVPDKMKKARVIPLYKKGSVNLPENYRPISILPIFSKILERAANTQLLTYLESNQLLSSHQYGFRKDTSTTDTVIEFKNGTLQAFNDGKCVLGIFIDFSKAFDPINHSILLQKLRLFNFNETAILWIKNYLSNRTQVTWINGKSSQEENISCGVPQGSILASTLFLIYINDLTTVLKILKPILYADDTNLFYES